MCSLVSEAIAKHEKRYKDDMNNKVDKWKEALHQVANLSGYHFKYNLDWAGMDMNTIGLESPVLEVASLLDVESNAGVHMVDDIDDPEQLIAIAGKPDWFGRGSRILITTWDKHLLTLHSIEMTYEIQALNEEESLDLLNWKAFKIDIVNLRMTGLIIMMIMLSMILPNHKKHPLLLESCMGLWTLLFLALVTK
ncbi:hypothetical protein HN51_021046 [Arachis hypogaea]